MPLYSARWFIGLHGSGSIAEDANTLHKEKLFGSHYGLRLHAAAFFSAAMCFPFKLRV